MIEGKIYSINISREKGRAKSAVTEAMLIEGYGIEGDAHAGPGLRQVSILSLEKISGFNENVKAKGKEMCLKPGDFAENITSSGLDVLELKVGDSLKIGKEPVLEISKIGKDCHSPCMISKKAGDCIMPNFGVFARVIRGGSVSVNDNIEALNR